jgi:putative ABC transport system substrate-binding protein
MPSLSLGAGMRRRAFIAGLGSTVTAWPMRIAAQERQSVRRIGLMIAAARTSSRAQLDVAGFRAELAKRNWIVGQNVQIDERWVTGDTPEMRPVAVDLVATRPQVILVSGPGALSALKGTATAIPIVFVAVSDPVGQGFINGFAKPGGTITGFTSFDFARIGKLMEVLREAAPQIDRIALLYSPNNPNARSYIKSVEGPARVLGVKVHMIAAQSPADIEQGLSNFAAEPNGGLVVPPNYITSVHRDLIFTLAARHSLPAIYPERDYATAGGLIAYGPDRSDFYRAAAGYVDRILRGEKPGDLPVQIPTKYELVINLQVARAINVIISPTLLARADEVIE